MHHRIIFKQKQWHQLLQHLLQDDGRERMAFAYGGISRTARGDSYLLKTLDLPEDKEYRHQGAAVVTLKTDSVVLRLARAKQHSVFLDCHSHPFTDRPCPSQTDELGAIEQLRVLHDLAPDTTLIRMILGKSGQVWAEVWQGQAWEAISEIRILGGQQQTIVRPINHQSTPTKQLRPEETRTRAVLGESACISLRQLHILVLGVGGVGSSVVAQLRGYIDDLTLIDIDIVEAHNAPRFWAYAAGDEGMPKVRTHQREIQRAFPQVNVQAIQAGFPSSMTLEAFKQADIIFCCTDNNASRYAAAQAASRFCKPLIEVGCGGKQTHGRISALGYHVRLQVPGFACLACNGMDLSKLEDPSTTAMKHQIGYIEEGDLIQGELMPLTARAAADAVDLFFRYATGYAPVSHHLYFDALSFKVIDLTPLYHSHPDCPICGDRKDALFATGDHLSQDQQILLPEGLPGSKPS